MIVFVSFGLSHCERASPDAEREPHILTEALKFII